jgi:hypothetical protein
MVFEDLLKDNFISSETMVFRREALEKLDYIFDDELTMVMDYDLTLRLAYRYPIDYVEESLSKWRMHEGSESSKKRFLIPRENGLMLKKLIRAHPSIETRYLPSISVLMGNVNYQLGLEKWSEGRVDEARRMLKRCRLNHKVVFAFLATYLMPFAVFDESKVKIKELMLGGRFCKS